VLISPDRRLIRGPALAAMSLHGARTARAEGKTYNRMFKKINQLGAIPAPDVGSKSR